MLKLANLAASLARFHRLVPLHTPVNKLAGLLLFLLPFGIGSGAGQGLAAGMIVALSIATLAAIQEGYLIRAGKEIE